MRSIEEFHKRVQENFISRKKLQEMYSGGCRCDNELGLPRFQALRTTKSSKSFNPTNQGSNIK
jgi:hypothetical protein